MIVSPMSLALREAAIAPRLTCALSTQRNQPPWAVQSRSASFLTKQFASSRQPILFNALATQPRAVRYDSSIASPATNTTPQPSSNPSPQEAPGTLTGAPPTLTWNRFLHLRSIRRRYNLVASITTSLATTAAGISLLSQQDMDKLGSLLFGLDPIMAMGVGAVGCGALGWLLGPFAGNAAFGIWYRRLGPEMAVVGSPPRSVQARMGVQPGTYAEDGKMYTNLHTVTERERILPTHQTPQS
ncbi:TIM23 complex component [Xylographa trunciseda]|nr:TIM23 complex component [Xylographa trunciseda]